MALTYQLVVNTTLSATTSSVTLSSIPSTYTDLILWASVRTNTTNNQDYLTIRPNAATTGTTSRYIWSTGLNDGSSSSSEIYGPISGNGSTSNTFGVFQLYIPNYSGSTNKPMYIHSAQENNTTGAEMYVVANLWSNTTAISSLQLWPYYNRGTTLFQIGTTFSLYGIKNS